MSGPTALTALAAAGAVTLLTFVALAQVADVFGGARHRQVMRLTGARPGTAAGPSTGLLGVAAAGVQALGRHLWRHQRLVTVQDLREAGLEAAWITPRTVVATKLALGAGVGLALGLLTPWVPAMMVGAPIGGLLGFVVPSLVIDGRRAARRARILAEVPDVIAELRGLIGAGMGVERALHVLVADDASGAGSTALARELRRTMAAYGLGVPLSVALQEASDRLGAPEFEAFVLALKQARRLGAELDAVLDQQEAGLRAQRQSAIDGEVSAQEAKAQLVIAVCFLPAFMLLIFIPMLLSIMQGLFG